MMIPTQEEKIKEKEEIRTTIPEIIQETILEATDEIITEDPPITLARHSRMNVGFTRDTSGLTAVRTQTILETGKTTTEEEVKDKNTGKIAKDNLLILRQAAMKLRQEEEDVDVGKDKKIMLTAVHPENLTSLSGLKDSILATMKIHPNEKNLSRLMIQIKTTRKQMVQKFYSPFQLSMITPREQFFVC